ncbi:ArsR family transcriptional regulator [Thermoplasma sp. Kam2015]|uniref:ArsR/SmtB family transcription factor n=1 Tax=Thermoplasma sp. Kam2015 TaxID=2094122 RepID=UPI000DA0D101|nr:winged helix-turn-helix domain-containing protein [Thermoplasma sp. Kam2015]PYB67830.1 ArsR family transcriptional regulator [Thermoplasma sp. Kam2015]
MLSLDPEYYDEYRRLIWWLFFGTRGGPMRLRIIEYLKDKPSNLNQISASLGINYRTAEHHAKILEDNGVLVSEGDKYGKIYYINPAFANKLELIDKFRKKD